MPKSIKPKDNTYIDSKGVSYKRTDLETTIDNIKASIPTKTSQLTNNSGYVATSGLPIIWSFNTTTSGSAGLEEFKNHIINNAPMGFSWWYIGINGAVSCALVQKANSSYLSFLHFSYAVTLTQYKYLAGTWYTTNL